MDHPHTGPNIRRLFRAALLLGAGLSAIGCVATIDNDARGFGGDDDRWYTGGWRLQRDLAAGVPDSERSWLDAGADAVAAHLDLLPAGADEPPGFTTVSLVAGQQFFTPANLKASTLIEDDRPYAGWLYAGVVRFDTWLDSDDGARRDVEHSVELDLGVVGPDSYAEQIQSALHSSLVDGQDPEGWDHQLGNEPGIVLRLSRAARDGYAERAPGGLAADAISRIGGAVGNVDTHAGLAETVRFGWNLPRSFDAASGDRRRLLPGGARGDDEPASLYGFAGADGRLVLRNIFLDGNTFQDSHSIDKQPLVGSLLYGLAWEHGAFRVACTRTHLTREFDGQPEGQVFGSLTVSWARRF